MAEAKKEAPASAGTKKKSSVLVEEIDEDFLTSWKSIKVAEDADFESGAPPSKTKGFKFGKLDMDFSLDGDFNDLPSFKLDMGDLDFTSPAKKEGNIKERSDKEIAVKSKGNKDLFTLDFNFNESDGFDLDTGFSKAKKSDKSNERDGFSIQEEVNKAPRKEMTSNNDQLRKDLEAVTVLDSGTALVSINDAGTSNPGKADTAHFKAPRKEMASNNDQLKKDLEAVTMLDSGTALVSINDAGTSNPGKADTAHFSHTDSMENAGENTLTETTGRKTGSPQQSPARTLRERTEQRDCTGKVDESFVPETSAESYSGGDRVLITASEVQPPDTELHADVAMRNVSNRKMKNLRSFSGTSASKDCYSPDEESHIESDSESKEVVESRDLSLTKLSEVNASGQSPEITNTAGKVNGVGTDIPKHDSMAQSSRPSLRSRMVSFTGNSSPLGLSKAVDKSQDIRPQHPTLKSLSTLGGKLVSIATHPGTKSLAKVSNDASDRRIQVSRIGELKNHLQAQPESDVSSQKTPHKDACTSITRNGNYKSLPIVAAPAQDLVLAAKITPTLTHNFSPIITPTLKQKSSPLSGVHKILNNTTPDIPAGQSIAARKEAVNAKQPDVRIQLTLNSKMKNIVGSNKIAAVSPSLKRKSLEETNTDSVILNPLKQRRGPSCESREPQVAPEAEMLEKTQESLTKDVAADVLRNYFGDCTSNLLNHEANMITVEVPLLIEKDSNIEKAEACSKELDELCNMLKKKNEEAKEILVRAVVNNNLLLMLNHPIYEEKIQKLQRLLTNLTLAERSF